MDLLYNYLPDVYSYQSMRHPAYDNASLQDNRRKDSYRSNANRKLPACGSSKSSKGNCPICQEKQRRPLANYIRSKSTQDRKKEASICEEEEEEEEHTSSKDQQGTISQPK